MGALLAARDAAEAVNLLFVLLVLAIFAFAAVAFWRGLIVVGVCLAVLGLIVAYVTLV